MRLPLLCSPRSSDAKPLGPTGLPHFTAANGDLHAPQSPRRMRARGPEDLVKTPIVEAIDSIRDVTAKIRASLDRMHQTERAFECEAHDLSLWIQQIEADQALRTQAYAEMFETSAIHVQRVFRGFMARRIVRDALALRAVRKIQRAFRAKQTRRAERRRQFRIMSKKVLRGLKSIRARQELTYNELLNRVSHNMMIERQWRMAMGLVDTDSDLLHALYRRKFVRQRVAAVFQKAHTLSAIVRFWQRIVPRRLTNEELFAETNSTLEPPVDLTIELETTTTEAVQEEESAPVKPSLFSLAQQLTSPSKPTKTTPKPGRNPQEELRRKQKLYTQRIYEENLKKEAARAAQLEKQREQARLAEEARKIQEEEQRRLRLEQAQALRDDLERRGLLAIRELQARKEEELRKEEEVQQRIAHAKQRIAQAVLSDETQMLLARKQRAKPQD